MKELLAFHWRLLTFRVTAEELDRLGLRHLALGLLWTWLAGMGRWWDDPKAGLLQHLGLGSLAYVFLLAGVLWMFAAPLRPRRWSYPRVLIYVTLTAPPAILYALPVERWLNVGDAAILNLAFLAVVAAWRVSLWVPFVHRYSGLSAWNTFLSLSLPLLAVIMALTVLNLARGIIPIMAGMRDPTAEDLVGGIFLVLGVLSVYAFVPMLILYLVQVCRMPDKHETQDQGDEG